MATETAQRQAAHFDAVHAARDDPWGLTSRWYEIRKRAVLLASLPDECVGRTLEVGCSSGILTEALADRSERVVALDMSGEAVESARRRLGDRGGVDVRRADVRDGLPDGPWDLVVLSEVGYYLDAPGLLDVLGAIERSLSPTGSLAVCHWRHAEEDFAQSGDGVHRLIAFETSLDRIVHHEEADFAVDVYSADGRSVGARTGLVAAPGRG